MYNLHMNIPADEYETLEKRVGTLHLKQRLGIESDHETQVFGRGFNFFHIENWYSIHGFIRFSLGCVGLLGRGRRNTGDIRIVHNSVGIAGLPKAFEGYTILHISDLHLDINSTMSQSLIRSLKGLEYDLCVLTGDFRARTHGSFVEAIKEMENVRGFINKPVFGVLGNHDSIRMVSPLEALDVRMLLNEHVVVERGDSVIYLAGIDDPHYFCMDNIEKAAQEIPSEAVSIMLAHSPEIYRRVAYAGFDLMLCGHTHGGQICLPGGVPLTYNARCPRQLCAGPWKYHRMVGYTSVGSGVSVVDVRLNCPPEITLHHLSAL